MKIVKVVDFAAAHSIKGAGKCERKHGHNWEATITVESDGKDDRGFIADVRDIKYAAYKYDHNDLDNYFEYASTENVAQKIADDVLEIVQTNLKEHGYTYISVDVTLVETKNNSAQAEAFSLLSLDTSKINL